MVMTKTDLNSRVVLKLVIFKLILQIVMNVLFLFLNFKCLLSPDHRQRIGWGAISTALFNVLFNDALNTFYFMVSDIMKSSNDCFY